LILTGTDTGSGTIKDINGNLLDGDSNGNPGGDYWTVFGRVG
jgi:hypothetical protein